MASNYWVAMQKQKAAKSAWLRLNPNLNDASGIYVLTRIDENGLMYAYVGQAKHILTRLARHSLGYDQHIDRSLMKHKLYNHEKNPFGWKVGFINCDESKLNDYERKYILEYASKGYQLRNKTAGGQDLGKLGIDENRAAKGYRDGLKVGYQNCLKEIREFFDKYLMFMVQEKPEVYKKDGLIKELYLRKLKEFADLMRGENNERAENNNTMDQESN